MGTCLCLFICLTQCEEIWHMLRNMSRLSEIQTKDQCRDHVQIKTSLNGEKQDPDQGPVYRDHVQIKTSLNGEKLNPDQGPMYRRLYTTVQFSTLESSRVNFSRVKYTTVQFSTVESSRVNLRQGPTWPIASENAESQIQIKYYKKQTFMKSHM